MDVPERYVRLCLRVGRHVEGFIDAYIGPPEWQESAAAEEPLDPGLLHEEAQSLLDGLDDSGLEEDRRRWLRGQLEAIECVTARLAGEEQKWADEVERCFGVRPGRTKASVFEEARRRLDAALPGSGHVRDRYIAWGERNAVPRDSLVPALERLKDALGPRAHALAPMPADEAVAYELVSGVPWVAYNWYEGRYRSRCEINADLPISIVLLADLGAHEAYPGHHTERVAKDAGLYRERRRVETGVAVIIGPECIVAEGIATNALEQALGNAPFAAIAEVLAGLDVAFDASEAQEIYDAELLLEAVGTNAAFMLYEDDVTTAEAEEYMRDWALVSDERAARAVSFLTDPTSRTYVSTYGDGRRLVRDYAERAPGNFTKLLTEQLTTADLVD